MNDHVSHPRDGETLRAGDHSIPRWRSAKFERGNRDTQDLRRCLG